jgi:hypothetical protein
VGAPEAGWVGLIFQLSQSLSLLLTLFLQMQVCIDTARMHVRCASAQTSSHLLQARMLTLPLTRPPVWFTYQGRRKALHLEVRVQRACRTTDCSLSLSLYLSRSHTHTHTQTHTHKYTRMHLFFVPLVSFYLSPSLTHSCAHMA